MPLTSHQLLVGYREGVFPMDGPDGLHWYRPHRRAVIPLGDAFHVPASLARVGRSGRFHVTTDRAFEAVMRACAVPRPEQPGEGTWISEQIVAAYTDLHRQGAAHSVEVWDGGGDGGAGALAGGLYGVALGGAFFGESMFHRARDASKVALVALVERLRAGGFVLLDTQFLTPHLARFGAYEMPRAAYEARLADALRLPARWPADQGHPPGHAPGEAASAGPPAS